MKEIFIGVTLLIVMLVPFAAIGWIVYRMIMGNDGNNNSITGG